MNDRRVVFDFALTFSNGGGLQGQEFRLDIDTDEISDEDLADYVIEDLRLLLVSEVEIFNKRYITEAHKRVNGVSDGLDQPRGAVGFIDHVYLPVSDMNRSRDFYRPLLETLDMSEGLTFGDSVVFGLGEGAIWIYPVSGRTGVDDDPCGIDPEASDQPAHIHVALKAQTRAAVIEFYKVATSLGAVTVEAPRLFASYHPSYFAAFVRDPDGHVIEAVCSQPS